MSKSTASVDLYLHSVFSQNIIAPEGIFVVSSAKSRGDVIAKLVYFSSGFPLPDKFRKRELFL